MTQTPEEIFSAMNASRILVAILSKIESIEIPSELFMSANDKDKQLAVSYNDETSSFKFELTGVENVADDTELNNN